VEAAPKDAAVGVTRLERHDPARHMARFYAVQVVPTLFGSWALIREWGRIGSPGTAKAPRKGSARWCIRAAAIAGVLQQLPSLECHAVG
jgi:predicted DNA-binding WGR domain protein